MITYIQINKDACHHAWEECVRDNFKESFLLKDPLPVPPSYQDYLNERAGNPHITDWWERRKAHQESEWEHEKRWKEAYLERYGRPCILDTHDDCQPVMCETCLQEEIERLERIKAVLVENKSKDLPIMITLEEPVDAQR